MRNVRSYILMSFFLFSRWSSSAFPEGSNLELQYVILYDDAWNDLREKTVKSGSELTLQVKYTRKGFPKKSKTRIKIKIFDAQGHLVLQDEEERPPMEGTRRDRYGFTIPKGISGNFLISATLQVFQKKRILAKISRIIPFDVVP